MLSFFPKQTVTIPGFSDEQWSITRVGRGKTQTSINNQFQALVSKNTNVTKGAVVTSEGEGYFVITLEKSFVNTVCQLRKTNATIDIVRVTKHFTLNSQGLQVQDYLYEVPVSLCVPAFYEDITGKMQQYDQGILATSTRRFLIPMNSNVKLQDRIKFNSENMVITAINSSLFPGLLQIQTMVDSRVTR